jgi:hypothetical protein
MKTLIFALIAFTNGVHAAQEMTEVTLKTTVAEATVFIKGAQVVRQTTADIPAGRSTLRFVGLSPYIDAKSVQVKAEGEVMVLSINHQTNYNDSIQQDENIKLYGKQLGEIEERIQKENASKEIIQEELTFLRENNKIGGTAGVNFDNLKATATYYGERITALKMKELDVNRKLRELEDEKRGLKQQTAAAGGVKPEPTGEVLLIVESKTAQRLPLVLSYFVDNAGWYPSYDVRAKNISEPLELVYKANIMQNTKEEWRNVRLKISSANPNLGSVARGLKTYLLNYHILPPRYNNDDLSNQVRGRVLDTSGQALPGASIRVHGSTIGTDSDLEGNFSLPIPATGGELTVSYVGYQSQTLPISNRYMQIRLEEAMLEEVIVTSYGALGEISSQDYVEPRASAGTPQKAENIPLPTLQAENQTSIEFEIKTPYTILSENKNTTIEMEHYSLPAEYEYHCVPKVDKDAFLMAHIPHWEQYNLLEGEANIFFENTFIGKTILDVRYVRDTLDVSLGRDKNVSVQREKIKEYTTQRFLGSKTETTRAWKITVRNNKSQAVSMLLFDQIPVSTNQEIEVSAETLSDASLTTETGELKWKLTLPPSERKELNFSYKVKYPKGKTLIVE